MNWYQESKQTVLNYFQVDPDRGLSTEQVNKALKAHGQNHIHTLKTTSPVYLFIQQFIDPLTYLLLASAAVIFFAGSHFDAFIVLGILVLNATVGTIQEINIKKMLDHLTVLKKSTALVIRNGEKEVIAEHLVVPGDIVLLQEGEKVPADGRIIEAYNLTVNQSILTGESHGVPKSADTLTQSGDTQDTQLLKQQENLPVTAMNNMVFAGSLVLTGYAKIVVTATGKNTQAGMIDTVIQEAVTEFPLQQDLEQLLKFILWSIVALCCVLFGIGLFYGKPFAELLASLVALFMCVVPQGVPMIMTLILVTNAHRLTKAGVVIKRLPALEGLGRAQVIVFDKTGTLTRNELMVGALFSKERSYTVTGSGYTRTGEVVYQDTKVVWNTADTELQQMLLAAVLLNRSQLVVTSPTVYSVKGNPSEAALYVCAQKMEVPEGLIKDFHELYEIPFSAAYQYHAGFYNHKGRGVMVCIGSPEVIKLRSVVWKEQDDARVSSMMQAGMRVLAVGYKEFSFEAIPEDVKQFPRFFAGVFDSAVTFVGAFGIHDGLRSVSCDVVSQVQRAGIQVVIATGDSQETALYTAQQVGLLKDGQGVLDGPRMQRLTDAELQSKIESIDLYARVLPDDKLRIITAFQKIGKTVVMVGDGVNDAPSMAQSHIGVVMGGMGSQVAKDAADIMLLKDQLEALPVALRYGRHVFYTFKRVIMYFFTSNFSEILVMLIGLAGNFPVPFLAAHILWLNLVTDGFLDASLALEEPETGLLTKKWASDHAQVIDRFFIARVVSMAFVCAGITFGIFWWYYSTDLVVARTMAVVMLTALECVNAVNMRSLTVSAFARSPRDNWWLMRALGLVLVLLVAIVYVPWLQYIFQTTGLKPYQWGIIAVWCALFFVVEETRKVVVRKKQGIS